MLMKKPNVEDTFFRHMIAIVNYNNINFEIINVHLVPPLSMKGNLISLDTLYCYFYKSSILHLSEIQEMLYEVKNNIILCGDFNEGFKG
jgi:hypothetical protein